MKLGGFDPSMSNFGMVKGVYQDSLSFSHFQLTQSEPSKIKTVRKNSDDLERARKLHQAMQSFFADVDVVCVEIPVGSQSARAMCSYGMCIGILASLDKPLIQVTPTQLKQVVTGRNSGTKKEMIDWAMHRHPEIDWFMRKEKGELIPANKNEHLADAIAAIYAGMLTDEFKLLTLRK